MAEADEKEAEDIAMKEAEKLQNEETAAHTRDAIEAEIGDAKEQLKAEVKQGEQEILKEETKIMDEAAEKPKKKKKIDNRSAMEKAYDSA